MLTRLPRANATITGLAITCLGATAPGAATDRPVFVCRGPATVIFSDRPCGPLAEARVLQVPEPGPGAAPSVARAPTTEATRPLPKPQVADAKPLEKDDRCRRLRDQRERLDDQMRAGYSAREAARLWNRWRELDAKLYAARC